MPRCRICDYQYEMDFLSTYQDDELCVVCESSIIDALEEMEEKDKDNGGE